MPFEQPLALILLSASAQQATNVYQMVCPQMKPSKRLKSWSKQAMLIF